MEFNVWPFAAECTLGKVDQGDVYCWYVSMLRVESDSMLVPPKNIYFRSSLDVLPYHFSAVQVDKAHCRHLLAHTVYVYVISVTRVWCQPSPCSSNVSLRQCWREISASMCRHFFPPTGSTCTVVTTRLLYRKKKVLYWSRRAFTSTGVPCTLYLTPVPLLTVACAILALRTLGLGLLHTGTWYL